MTKATAEPELDLAAIAEAHPTRRVVLDLERLDVASLLSVGDVADMAEALGVKPEKLLSAMDLKHKPLEVIVVLAWVIGRKGEPELSLETVRRSWRIEVAHEAVTVEPDPTPAARRRRSSGPAISSRSPG